MKRSYLQFIIPIAVLVLIVAGALQLGGGPVPASAQPSQEEFAPQLSDSMDLEGIEVITLGGGCFWCVEAVYQRVPGVMAALSGYAGGDAENPTYYEVVGGKTGHAEVVQVAFDPQVITLEAVLNLFFRAHDPTTVNRQGNDVGPQYRSIVLYHTEEQRIAVEEAIEAEQPTLSRPIVTHVQPLSAFYPAEVYHQDYFDKNPDQAYCAFVIRPKLEKLELM